MLLFSLRKRSQQLYRTADSALAEIIRLSKHVQLASEHYAVLHIFVIVTHWHIKARTCITIRRCCPCSVQTVKPEITPTVTFNSVTVTTVTVYSVTDLLSQ
jgi:hypothetical protein